MSTPTIEQIHLHASVRKYKPDPLPKSLVDLIVSSGQRGSTSSNLQSYCVVAVTGRSKKDRLAELCANQEHIRQAPVFLAWCVDLSRLDTACNLRGYEQVTDYVENFLVAAMDVAIAMQTATLAAESLGLGMCYIGAIRNHPAEVIQLLELPRLVFPVSGMTLGWPAVEPKPKPRLPLSVVLHWESYSQVGEVEALREYDRLMAETGIYEGRQVSKPGIEGEVEMYGWLEHTARRISRPIRPGLREVLEDQGFDLK
ncbi:MAG: NADPH-dependent oxidoreductase [Chloroflexota bacterium]